MQSVSGCEYSQSNLIGHGAFALVFRGRKKKTHEPVAIKQIALKSVPGKLSTIRQKEIHILKELKHPNIVQLYDYLETKSDIFLIMEYCNGGDLGDYLHNKNSLSEDSICHLARHIAGSLRVLRQHHIIHRDIKPQNLLLSYPQGKREQMKFRDTTIKLADFGFARYLSGTDLAATLCGSPLYMAPEILLGERYDSLADLWSIGTILYQCLSGTAPFLASNPHALKKKYEKERLVPKIPEGTSHYLRGLLLGLLKKNPKERISHDDFFSHSFLRGLPSSLIPENVMVVAQPSQHAKSSPVPIRRHTNTPSPYSSPSPSSRRSISPRQRGSLETSTKTFFSPSSGPPSLHPVGSGLYTAQSPTSDITEQGFIVVDYPRNIGSRRYSSPSSTYGSSVPSHTPSSGNSLTRYHTLTTPFYQPAANSNINAAEQTVKFTSHFHNPGYPLSCSGKHNSSEGSPLSSTPPFSKLLSSQLHYGSSPLSSSPRSYSPHHSRRTSPRSTPPSLPSPVEGPGSRPGMRYALGTPGSGTKLSSLAEQDEVDSPQSRNFRRSGSGPKLSTCDDFITHSQLLNSDEEEEDFPLNLSLNLSQSTDDQEGGENDQVSSAARLVAFDRNCVKFSPHPQVPRNSSRPKRASSFSQKRTSPDLQHIRARAPSLSGLGNPFHDSNFTTTLAENKTWNFNSSPTSSIVPFHLPFLLSTSSSTNAPSQRSQKARHTVQRSQSAHGRASSSGPVSDHCGVADGESCLASLSQSMVLGEELLAMAKARQGPIMLLSTDLNSSGVVGRLQRCSEQLVLYAKAVTLLESGLRQYQIELAASNIEPGEKLKTAEAEVRELQETALERARQVREQILQGSIGTVETGHARLVGVSAERLLCLEALDMCKSAVLEERSGETKECVKRYRRAKLIFQHLLSDANTPRDRAVLKGYIQSVQKRIQHLAVS